MSKIHYETGTNQSYYYSFKVSQWVLKKGIILSDSDSKKLDKALDWVYNNPVNGGKI